MSITRPINQECIDQLNEEEVTAAIDATTTNLKRLRMRRNQIESESRPDLSQMFKVGDVLESALRDNCYYIVTGTNPDEVVTTMIHTDPTHIEVFPVWRLSRRDIFSGGALRVDAVIRKTSWSKVKPRVSAALEKVNDFSQIFYHL